MSLTFFGIYVWKYLGKNSLKKIWGSKKQKLLDVENGRTLCFDEYIASLCKNAGNKWSVLARLSNVMCTNNKKSFDESIYWITVWLLTFNLDVLLQGCQQQIIHLHEWSLWVIYKDNFIFFEDLFKRDISFTIQGNIPLAAIELKV